MFVNPLISHKKLIVKQNGWHTCQLFFNSSFIYNQTSKIILRVFMKYFSCSDLQKISGYLIKQQVPSSKKDFFYSLFYLTQGEVGFVSNYDLVLATGLHIRTIYRHLEFFKNLKILKHNVCLNSSSVSKHLKRKIQILLPPNLLPQNVTQQNKQRTLTFKGIAVDECSCVIDGKMVNEVKLKAVISLDGTISFGTYWVDQSALYTEAETGIFYFKAIPSIAASEQLLLSIIQPMGHYA